MKKPGAIIGISIGCLTLLLLFLKLSGIFSWHKSLTPSNEPALKTGELFFTTILKSNLQRGSFVVHTSSYADSVTQQGTNQPVQTNLYVKRLCGIPGDVIQMKNGVFFVNRVNFDKNYTLKAFYTITKDQLYTLGYNLDKLAANGDYIISADGSMLINLAATDTPAVKQKANIARYIHEKNDAFNWLGSTNNYTVDNFGPIKIPPGSYFLLGDNRHNSLDSRYTGFIKQEDIKALVLWK